MEASLSSDRQKGIFLVLTAGFCWGFHGVLIKFAYQLGASFMEVFLAEAIVASLVYSLVLFRSNSIQYPKALREWTWLLLAGLASLGIGSFLFLSFSLGPVAIGATLLFLYLPQVYLFSLLASKQRFDWVRLCSILILLLGAAITTDIIGAFGSSVSRSAILAGAAASICYAAIFLLTPRISQTSSASFRSLYLAGFNLVGSLVVLILLPTTRGDFTGNISQLALYAIVLGIIGQALPIFAMMKGIPLAGASLSGVLASTELPVAVLSSALILGESITPARAFGVALVFLGIAIFNLRKSS